MIMAQTLHKKLKTYSALTAVGLLSANTASADIIVNDINFTGLGSNPDSYDIDIDGDNVIDFSVSFNSTYYGNTAIPVLTNNNVGTNGINGSIGTFGGNSFLYPLNLNAGEQVDSNMSFNSTMSYGTLNYAGLSYGNFVDSEGYIGVAFDVSGDIHYGWIKLSTNADGTEFTIVSTAYNDTAGEGIGTGQTVGIVENRNISFNVSSNENSINITSDETLLNSTVQVIDLQGKIILTDVIKSTNTTINTDFPKGIYVVNIISEKGKAVSRKITL